MRTQRKETLLRSLTESEQENLLLFFLLTQLRLEVGVHILPHINFTWKSGWCCHFGMLLRIVHCQGILNLYQNISYVKNRIPEIGMVITLIDGSFPCWEVLLGNQT